VVGAPWQLGALGLIETQRGDPCRAHEADPSDVGSVDELARRAPRLWGVPVVETDAMAAGTALVGDFAKAMLFDRQSIAIALGTINDQFVRNLVTVIGEIRAGFGVVRPSAFVEVALA
jgi:hypothetical protein